MPVPLEQIFVDVLAVVIGFPARMLPARLLMHRPLPGGISIAIIFSDMFITHVIVAANRIILIINIHNIIIANLLHHQNRR